MDYSTGLTPADKPQPNAYQSPSAYQPYQGEAQLGDMPGREPGGDATSPREAEGSSSRRRALTIGISVLSLLLLAAAFVVRGEPERFMTVGLQFAPLAILAALAYGARRSTTAAVFTYVWLAILMLLVVFNSFASVMLVVTNIDAVAASQTAGVRPTLDQIFKAGAGTALLWATLLLTLALLASLSILLRPVRVFLSRIMPIDPDNFVHKIGLSIIALIFLTSLVPLIVLGGRPPILELISSRSLNNLGVNAGISVRPIDLVYQFVWMIPATLVAAGWLTARKFPAVLARLGMVRPSTRQVLFGLGAGLALAAFAMFGLDPGVNALWTGMGWEPTDVQTFDSLLSQLKTPIGAVLIGVTAGIGEEMAVRGLLQPRVGLIASNLLFTSLHAFQYGTDALISVFVIGTALGLVRARTNTSTSAIVHGVYNFTLVITSVILAGQ